MNIRAQLPDAVASLAVVVGLLVPGIATAQSTAPNPESGGWRYSATLYGYLPSIGGTTAFRADSAGTPINIGADQILDHLKFTFMGTMGAHNGRWGVSTDVIYLNVGAGKSQSRDFTIGDGGLPVGTSARLDLDLKSWVWTLAGEYRVASDPAFTMDVLAGTRMFDQQQRLRWSISGDIGPIAPAGRTGSAEANQTLWDGIVGVKGRYAFGAQREWSVPFYLDVGTGQSNLTWQGATGISYAFKWGELSGLWRYLAYDMKSGRNIRDFNFNGPMVGATFRW